MEGPLTDQYMSYDPRFPLKHHKFYAEYVKEKKRLQAHLQQKLMQMTFSHLVDKIDEKYEVTPLARLNWIVAEIFS